MMFKDKKRWSKLRMLFEVKLLDSKLRDIFSENMSTKVKNFSKKY